MVNTRKFLLICETQEIFPFQQGTERSLTLGLGIDLWLYYLFIHVLLSPQSSRTTEDAKISITHIFLSSHV